METLFPMKRFLYVENKKTCSVTTLGGVKKFMFTNLNISYIVVLRYFIVFTDGNANVKTLT